MLNICQNYHPKTGPLEKEEKTEIYHNHFAGQTNLIKTP